MTPAADSKERFSNRVADYIRYRPGYPAGVLDLLRAECGLAPESAIADVGSGTGILTKMLLDNGNLAYGVEPNAEMREAGEELLAAYPKFRSVAAPAEATIRTLRIVCRGSPTTWLPFSTRRPKRRRSSPESRSAE